MQKLKSRANGTGSALLSALLVMTIVSTLGAIMVQVHMSTSKQQLQAIDKKRAIYVAEAGLAESYLAISQGKSGVVGSEELPARFGDGVYWVEADEDSKGRITLKSNGLCGKGRFSAELVMQRRTHPIAAKGVFGHQEVVVGAGSLIDGFDWRDGSFDSQVDTEINGMPSTSGRGGRISGNGDVTLQGPVFENGSPAGPETNLFGSVSNHELGQLSVDPGVNITGATHAHRQIQGLPRIVPPELPSQGNLTHSETTPLQILGERRYRDLVVESGSELILKGPANLVVEELDLESGARLTFDPTNGPIAIYVTRELKMRAGSNVRDLAPSPQRVGFFISAMIGGGELVDESQVMLNSSGEFHGFMYAPGVDLLVPSTLRVFGAVGAGRVRLAPGSRYTFDHNLVTTSVGALKPPDQISWQVVDLPDAPIVDSLVDPIGYLTQLGRIPIPSHDAHRENAITISYRNLLGQNVSYTGLVSGFDWSDVQEVHARGWYLDAVDAPPAIPIMP